MANITISELRPAGADLFSDSESYIHDLGDHELNNYGGFAWTVVAVGVVVGWNLWKGYNAGRCAR
jgi:hypothetical protein